MDRFETQACLVVSMVELRYNVWPKERSRQSAENRKMNQIMMEKDKGRRMRDKDGNDLMSLPRLGSEVDEGQRVNSPRDMEGDEDTSETKFIKFVGRKVKSKNKLKRI